MSMPASLRLLSLLLVISGGCATASATQWPTADGSTSKHPVYKTADELREACAPLLKPIDPPHTRVQQYDDYMLFIVPYLGSKDADLCQAAADILAQLMKARRHIRASAFKEYLSRDHPTNVRVVALAHSLYGFVAEGEQSSYAKRRAEMEAAWTETLNDIAESPVTPLNFDVLVLPLVVRADCLALIKPENRAIMIRRLLALLPDNADDGRDRVMRLVFRFPLEGSVSEMIDWYRAQPDAASRAAFTDRVLSLSSSLSIVHAKPSSIDKLRSLKPILELAAQDPDPEIAKRAKDALEKAEAYIEQEKGRQEKLNN